MLEHSTWAEGGGGGGGGRATFTRTKLKLDVIFWKNNLTPFIK